jgi:S1-C subfamily serine protease
MRLVATCCALALAAPAWAVDWRPLPSPSGYQATVDLDSIVTQKGFTRFTVRRAYNEGQTHASGKEYFSARLLYVADCAAQSATLAVTQYYGADRKLMHADVRAQVRKSEFTAFDAGSEIAEALTLVCTKVAQSGGESDKSGAGPAKPGAPSVAVTPKPAPRSASGSGIVVSADGTILTNRHVVQQCDSYEVIDDSDRKLKATLLAVDSSRDLALLKTEEGFRSAALFRKDIAPKLGEAVTVVGYPLVGVLGVRPSVNFGHVSSTVGLRGDPTQMQISVPIQRGHSGGPVLDQSGHVIGVVVSKLDALKLAERLGDLPQNVNFAIRGEFARDFLIANRIETRVSGAAPVLANTEIASQGSAVTVRVRCLREGAATPAPTSAPARQQQ